MDEDILSARFDKLLKRYQDKLQALQLDLPPVEEPLEAPPQPSPAPEEPYAQPEPPSPPQTPKMEPEPETMVPQQEPPEPAAVFSPLPQPDPAPETKPGPSAEQPPLPQAAALEDKEEPAVAVVVEPPHAPGRHSSFPDELTPRPIATPAAPRKFLRAALRPIAMALAAAAVVIWWSYRQLAEPAAYQAFPFSAQAPRGLAWSDGRLVAADAQSQALLFFDADGKKLASSASLSNPALSALTWADGAFWSTQQDRSAIFQHDADAEHRIRRIYATANRHPLALASDNENLWVSDAQVAVVYRYLIGRSLNGTSLTPLSQYNVEGGPAAGLYAGDGLLWVLDTQSRHLRRYRYDAGTLTAVDTLDLGLRLHDAGGLAGMTVGQDCLWVLTSNPAALHRFALGELHWESARP